jgi:acetyl-CoA carboxylase biotin carboxylase subunit
MIDSLLIANRGEIACRVIRTCRRLGIRASAVYSGADTNALHVRLADEAIYIGPAPASESYLNVDAMLEAARRVGADAIHPGYGFLSENPVFARRCAGAGLIFVGPSPETIAALGDKHVARELAARAGVPVLPGYGGAGQSDAELAREAERIGYPLMVKAAAGGGGRGMRLVERSGDLSEALASARSEARQAFGSDALILERALAAPRHVEFQIFGDQHGGLVHLGERECSIQRRHQKVVEEGPSPALSPELRAAMGAAAVAVGRAAGYSNAGTVEFLLDREGGFYFLEINTRLQVEHPVTECLTGLDLVEWQIRVAEGHPLPLRQDEICADGHAIEARLYAEDPSKDFLPASGQILAWRAPGGEGVRADAGIAAGDMVGITYDSMLAKVIAHGPDRPTATRRLARALETAALLGVQTNAALLRDILDHPVFLAGAAGTDFLGSYFAAWSEPLEGLPFALIAVTLAQWIGQARPGGYWRNNPNRPQIFRYSAPPRADTLEVRLLPTRDPAVVQIMPAPDSGQTSTVELHAIEPWDAGSAHELTLTVDGHRRRVLLAQSGENWWVQARRGVVRLVSLPLLPAPAPPASAGGSLRAPMPGKVLALLVEPGQRVSKGDALLKLEAMKMEHTIRTAADGIVAELLFAPGDTVEADALLVRVQPLDRHEGQAGYEGTDQEANI